VTVARWPSTSRFAAAAERCRRSPAARRRSLASVRSWNKSASAIATLAVAARIAIKRVRSDMAG
jgi:hypothetical protein